LIVAAQSVISRWFVTAGEAQNARSTAASRKAREGSQRSARGRAAPTTARSALSSRRPSASAMMPPSRAAAHRRRPQKGGAAATRTLPADGRGGQGGRPKGAI
jgi:hypothetical protein